MPKTSKKNRVKITSYQEIGRLINVVGDDFIKLTKLNFEWKPIFTNNDREKINLGYNVRVVYLDYSKENKEFVCTVEIQIFNKTKEDIFQYSVNVQYMFIISMYPSKYERYLAEFVQVYIKRVIWQRVLRLFDELNVQTRANLPRLPESPEIIEFEIGTDADS